AEEALQGLHRVLGLDQAAAAHLHAAAAARHQLLRLALAQVKRVLLVPRLAAPAERVAHVLDRAAERGIAREHAQLQERLSLERRRAAARAVVARDRLERARARALLPVRPEPQVDVEDALLARDDQLLHAA